MANTSNPSQQGCTSPTDRDSSSVQDSTSSPALSPTTTTPAEVARKVTRLTLTEYTARTKQPAAAPHTSTHKSTHNTLPRFDEFQPVYRDGAQESLDALDFEVEVDPVCKLDNINVKLLQHYHGHFAQVPRRPWFMDMVEKRPRPTPSLWIRRKNDKLRTATRTSTSGSKVKRTVLLPATATITSIVNPYPALKKIKLSKPSNSTLRHREEPEARPRVKWRRYLELPNAAYREEARPRVKRRRHWELPDAAYQEEAEIEGYLDTHRSTPFPLLRLPRELRDQIYDYLTPDVSFWIGRPPVVGKQKNAVVERSSMHKSAALIKSKHSLIFVCRDTRDEFRSALWRAYVDDPDRQAALRVYDFDPEPISDMFTGCTALELPEVLAKRRRQRVHMYLTGIFDVIADWSSLIRVASFKHSSCAGSTSVTRLSWIRGTRSPGARSCFTYFLRSKTLSFTLPRLSFSRLVLISFISGHLRCAYLCVATRSVHES
jgi:hypothetical protein